MLDKIPEFVKNAIRDTDRVPDSDLEELLFLFRNEHYIVFMDCMDLIQECRPKIYTELFPPIPPNSGGRSDYFD